MTALCSDNSLFFPGEGSQRRHYFLEVNPLLCATLRGTGLATHCLRDLEGILQLLWAFEVLMSSGNTVETQRKLLGLI